MLKPVLQHRIFANLALPFLGTWYRSRAQSEGQLPSMLWRCGMGRKKSRSHVEDGSEALTLETHSSAPKPSKAPGAWLDDASVHSRHEAERQDAVAGVWEEPDNGQALHVLRSPQRAIVKEISFEVSRSGAGGRDIGMR